MVTRNELRGLPCASVRNTDTADGGKTATPVLPGDRAVSSCWPATTRPSADRMPAVADGARSPGSARRGRRRTGCAAARAPRGWGPSSTIRPSSMTITRSASMQGVEDVVGDDDGPAAGQHPLEEPAQQRGGVDVEGGHRLVEQQQLAGRRPGPGPPPPAGPVRRRAARAAGRRGPRRRPRRASAGPSARASRSGAPALRGPNATLSSALRCGNSSGSWASSAVPAACAARVQVFVSAAPRSNRTRPSDRRPGRCRGAAGRR